MLSIETYVHNTELHAYEMLTETNNLFQCYKGRKTPKS